MNININIRLAKRSDYKDIMLFIHNFWSDKNPLGTNKDLFFWQHCNSDNKDCNFVIAKRGIEIVGILGFIPYSHYDKNIKAKQDFLWLTTWKIRDTSFSGLGLKMLLYLKRNFKFSSIGTLGLNKKTIGIYKSLGFKTGILSRFFLINEKIKDKKLIKFYEKIYLGTKLSVGSNVKLLNEQELNLFKFKKELDPTFSKTKEYILNRYLKHPFYKYDVYKFYKDNKECLVIIRKCEFKGCFALRVVDSIGHFDVLKYSGRSFRAILGDAEYVDFYTLGLEKELQLAGLNNLNDFDEKIILPSYFEPFELTNVPLFYSYKSFFQKQYIFKGDGDQDRPSILSSNI